ncbi:hypothetical protein RUM44_006101 [Polyplax serrata]|uniref:Protein kinase domain-containing protein n=1 Tax=Polyplax serrata TaxID=468196 RepID=A0ABR1AZF2_POLSC
MEREDAIRLTTFPRGASSTVYKCLRKGRTEWACKILKKNILEKKLVQKEISRLLKLKHPNIVQLRDVFETEDELQLILELANGGELFERIVSRGYFTEDDAAQAVRHVLNALQYLHSNGIVHRGLKPENILYQSESESSLLKLGDFGVNMFFSSEGLANSRAFGLYAPEILQNKECDSSIDLWSLGVITYIMLCGFEPFLDDNNQGDLYERVIEGDWSFPSPWWDDVSDSAKELISRLLSVDPKSRPTAAEALNHPWILGISTSSLNMNETLLRLKEFNARRRFRVATTAVIATRRALSYLPTSKSKDKEDKTVSGSSTDSSADGTAFEDMAAPQVDSMEKHSVEGRTIEEKASSNLVTDLSAQYKDGYAADLR